MTSKTQSGERRSTQRGAVAEAWTDAQRDAWRTEGFKMQIAQEASARKNVENMQRAVWLGIVIGIGGYGLTLLF